MNKMCKFCEINPVYEFTNKRKLCKICFINYFNKKFLFCIRKYNLFSKNDKLILLLDKHPSFKEVVLKYLLESFKDKIGFELFIKEVDRKNKNKNYGSILSSFNSKNFKIVLTSSIDSESLKFLDFLINQNKKIDLREFYPKFKNKVKPLYLFLDEEILLYAKIKNFSFDYENNKKETKKIIQEKNKEKIYYFLKEMEKNHPEIKRAIINNLLKII